MLAGARGRADKALPVPVTSESRILEVIGWQYSQASMQELFLWVPARE
jgi:hypothetical protein